jgi:hypothetical protein
MRKIDWFARRLLLAMMLAAATASPALAHEAPKGGEWVMADWMFLSFIIFAGTAFLAFMLALKAGWLSNLEEAKYYILEIEEEDYYTPTWAQTGGES